MDITKQNLGIVLPAVGGLAVLATIGQYLTINGSLALGGLVQLGVLIAAVIVGYIVLETMLKQAGLMAYSGPRRFLPFLGLSIVVGVGVILGMILLIVPGVYLAVRWSLAQPRLVGRGDGVFDAIKASWKLTDGYAMRIFLCILALGLVVVVIAIIAGLLGPTNIIGILIGQLANYALTMVMLGLSVTLLGEIDPLGRKLSEVFE
ncbi:glycerophosphoryl diester phosphodiesterase membrane domain-containing protein [Croceibacterium xixiisoli]|uniref:glycerophosphoryl diester phosphodiesterase membrane domain-containing protein n=1 Tax=Croceibacterium xixiisoli TaxID=1476466 RepID=UPI0013703309|nr:glycerophosphoryl diester phosphodiesterase membrane domain-containing protein [Croceibacterium xixiisoli]